ncbi:protein sel-1 homolog 3 isoform X4 [Osmerus mordax]|uniref:protein sel-1 homolog 3 isoform X4 n=1 Tax=Osmerus mordax TaxID=8014 RepID=UPI00350FE009
MTHILVLKLFKYAIAAVALSLQGSSSLERTSRELPVLPPSDRLTMPHTRTPSWGAELLWRLEEARHYQCPHESATVDMLKFPLASTGENFGVVRTFVPFSNRELERERLRAVERPRATVSVWVYLLSGCLLKLCGIIHHVDSNNTYQSPLIQLSSTGNIVVQVRLARGEDKAFRSHTALPLRTWTRLDFYIQDSKVTLEVTAVSTAGEIESHTHVYDFNSSIHYNDTSGYFVIGGSMYIPGITGYFGPIKYYRIGTDKVVNPLCQTSLALDRAHRKCEDTRGFTAALLHHLTDHMFMTASCPSYFVGLWNRFGQKVCLQSWEWETQKEHRDFMRFLSSHHNNLLTESWTRSLGRKLFEHVVTQLSAWWRSHPDTPSSLLTLLQVSSCSGHHQASLLMAALHLSGLGGAGDPLQAQVLSLMGASGDERLCLMHLGYKHSQGLDGFPRDLGVACSYYTNAGAQTVLDHGRAWETEQYITEHVHLSVQEEIDRLTHQSGDSFQFLQFNAERGDVESQKFLAKILFGRNGATKDVARALRWYKTSAMETKDPSSMYDYSVLLLKGQGVKRNKTLGLKLMEKAAAMGSAEALNGLGWYHGAVLRNHSSAALYFQQAAHNGSANAMHNLGIYHLSGHLPGNPQRNETAAFLLFLNASAFGHVEAAVQAAWYLSTGHLPGVSRDEERAVIMLKRVCEQNGFLGYVVQAALQAYLQGSMTEALVKYVLAAETGLGVAQNNAAYLCEGLGENYDCQWRYHNYSTLNHNPHPSGLLKMGDLFYHGGPGVVTPDVVQAISLYTRAGLAGSSQGFYNLAVVVLEGHAVPGRLQRQLNVSQQDDQEAVVVKLLLRCVREEEEEEEEVLPCALLLLALQMGRAWRSLTQDPIQLSLAYASVVSALIALIGGLMQTAVDRLPSNQNTSDLTMAERAGTTPVSQTAANGNGTQDDTVRREVGSSVRVRRAGIRRRRGQRFQQTIDWAVSTSGVCLITLATLLLYQHL